MERYIARCQKKLKEWHAPLEGWLCIEIIDTMENDENGNFATCELCGCEKVRFIHIMQNEYYFEDVAVGCICAGVMEDDILAAKERDRLMRNRAKRRKNFIKRQWMDTRFGDKIMYYNGKQLHISQNNSGCFCVSCNGKTVKKYKRKQISNFLSAVYAAFDLVDPIEEIIV